MTTSARVPGDVYPTPLPLVKAAIERLSSLPETRLTHIRVLDPGAGSGVWGRTTREVYLAKSRMPWPVVAHVHGCDLPEVPLQPDFDGWHSGNFLDYPEDDRYELIVGNPPYAQAEAFVHKSLSLCSKQGHVYFLLRLNFLEGQKRYQSLWKTHHLKATWVFPKRPSFNGEGTDMTGYSMFLFVPGYVQSPTLGFIEWSDAIKVQDTK